MGMVYISYEQGQALKVYKEALVQYRKAKADFDDAEAAYFASEKRRQELAEKAGEAYHSLILAREALERDL